MRTCLLSAVLALSALVASAMAQDEAPSTLPASAASAVKTYDDAVAKSLAEHQKHVVAEADKLVAALKKAQDSETKAGHLEAAMAIKSKIEAVQKDLPKPEGQKKPVGPEAPVLGKWSVSTSGYSGTWEFKDGGKVTGTGNDAGSYKIAKGLVTVSWPNGNVETMKVPGDGEDTSTGTGAHGAALAFKKVTSPEN